MWIPMGFHLGRLLPFLKIQDLGGDKAQRHALILFTVQN
jgi:hypothetical protein